MKKSAALLALIFACRTAFSYSGIMSGYEGKLKIARTEYFDIIYAPESERTANILYENADRLFDELCEIYIVPHKFRTTVSISPAQDQFNAYFTQFPYNSIVIYDTPPEDSMMVFSETVLNTFRHELIHAITYNSKNSALNAIGKVFGDAVNPALFTVTLGMAEGATVSTESDKGEGRMNSDIHKLLVKQAKIEGKFPKYSEIQGSRDTVPSGNLSYYFGGAFSSYLQEKYGFEKFAQFWHNAVNIQKPSHLFYFTNFKKVYGISIKEAWNDFYKSVEIPDVKANPWEEEWISLPEHNPPRINKKGSYYSALAANQKGYIYHDSYTDQIVLVQNDGKTQTLFKASSISRISSSPDGKFVSVSGYKSNNETSKSFVIVVNMESGFSYTFKENGIRDGTVFKNGEDYYVAAVKTNSQNSSLRIYRLNLNEKGRIKSVDAITEFKAPFEDIIFSPSGTMDGKVFFIYKNLLDFSICVYDFEKDLLHTFSADEFYPENGNAVKSESANSGNEDKNQKGGERTYGKPVFLQLNVEADFENGNANSLSENENTNTTEVMENQNGSSENKNPSSVRSAHRVSFTYTQKGTMPRLGILKYSPDFSDVSFEFSENESSGGMFNTTIVQEKLVFMARRFEDRKILFADLGKMNFRKISAKENVFSKITKSEIAPDIDAKQISFEELFGTGYRIRTPAEKSDDEKLPVEKASKKYSSLAYTFTGQNGLFLPFAANYTYGFSKENNSLSFSKNPNLFGVSYYSASPWTIPIWGLSAGFNPFTFGTTISGEIYNTTNFSVLNAKTSLEFDPKGFKQVYGALDFSHSISSLGSSFISFINNLEMFYGRQSDFSNFFAEDLILQGKSPFGALFYNRFETEHLFIEETAQLALGNMNLASPNLNSRIGWQATAFFQMFLYGKTLEEEPTLMGYTGYRNLGFDFLMKFPRLLPFEDNKLTFNLPLTLEATLFPSQKYFASAKAEAVLFSAEIQKSTNTLPIFYFNRLSLKSAYRGKFSDDITKPLPSFSYKKTSDYMGKLFSGKAEYYDELSFTLSLEATPNFGGFARSSFKFSLDTEFFIRFNREPEQNLLGLSVIGITIF